MNLAQEAAARHKRFMDGPPLIQARPIVDIKRAQEEKRQREDSLVEEARAILLRRRQEGDEQLWLSPWANTISVIQKTVCDHFGLTRFELLSARRDRACVRPRQVGMYLAKKLTSQSMPVIGRLFGDKDHTTVLYSIERVEGYMGEDEFFRKEVAALTVRVQEILCQSITLPLSVPASFLPPAN